MYACDGLELQLFLDRKCRVITSDTRYTNNEYVFLVKSRDIILQQTVNIIAAGAIKTSDNATENRSNEFTKAGLAFRYTCIHYLVMRVRR